MLVFDTNIWVSYALFNQGFVGQTVSRALVLDSYAFSKATFRELVDVMMRPKFDSYFTQSGRENMLHKIAQEAQWFDPSEQATECRDPKDNMFLDLARASEAGYLITGDEDLLVLDPYHHTRIVTPRWFSDEKL